MERYITDINGHRTAVVLDIEEYKTLVEAAEDADDARFVDKVREAISHGEDEMIPYHQAREEMRRNRQTTGA
jgi:hypothetical protein